MKKLLSLVAAMGLLSFVGCGVGDEGAGSSSGDGVLGRVSLNTPTPVYEGAPIRFEYSNVAFESGNRGWRVRARGGFVRFVFSGKHGFLYHVGGTSKGSRSCSVNVTVNGIVYESNKTIPITWDSYLVPASALGDGENTVQITQATDLALNIMAVAVGDGGDFEPAVPATGGSAEGRYSYSGTVYDDYTEQTTRFSGTFTIANGNVSYVTGDPNTVIRGTVDWNGNFSGQLRFLPGGVQTMTGTFTTGRFSLTTVSDGRYTYTFSASK